MSGRIAHVIMHTKCRNAIYPLSTISRALVPDDKVDWTVSWPEYSPQSYTSPSSINKPWSDQNVEDSSFDPRWNALDLKIDRRSHMGTYQIVNAHPRNPCGRTGIIGRGLLGRWGPNHAADPIVTRWKKEGGNKVIDNNSGLPLLQFVAIQRRDSGQWAIPGGMVDPGELITKTLQREFSEEALNIMEMTVEEKEKIQKKLEEFFQKGVEIYRGYVDDPRNTDNSWMETVAVNFHDEYGSLVGHLSLNAGDDAMKVKWMDIDSKLELYASHTQLLKAVTEKLNAHWQ